MVGPEIRLGNGGEVKINSQDSNFSPLRRKNIYLFSKSTCSINLIFIFYWFILGGFLMPLQASIGLIKSNTSSNQSHKSLEGVPKKSLPYNLNIYTITSSMNAKTFFWKGSPICAVFACLVRKSILGIPEKWKATQIVMIF